MAAFLQQMRASEFPATAPVAKDVAAMVVGEGFVELEGDELADDAALHEFLHLLVHRRVTQDEAEREDATALTHSITDAQAVLELRGEGLFAEDMLPGSQGGDGLLGVVAVERADENPRDVGRVDQGLLGLRDDDVGAEFLPGGFLRDGVRVVNRGHLNRACGFLKDEVDHVAQASSGSDEADFDGR